MAIGVRRSSTGILYSFTPKMWTAERVAPSGGPGGAQRDLLASERSASTFGLLGDGTRLALYIEIFHFERVLLDEVAPGLHLVTHQGGKDVVHPCNILELDLQQQARLGVHRRLPELRRVHFSQTFVALDCEPVFADLENCLQ